MIVLLIKASLIIIVLLAFYKAFLEKESFFAANRIYLLGCLVIACTFPFLVLPELVKHQGGFSTLIESFAEQGNSLEEKPTSSYIKEKAPKSSATSPEKPSPLFEPNTIIEQQYLVDNSMPTEAFDAKHQHAEKELSYWLMLLYFFGVAALSLKLLAQITHTLWKVYMHEDKIEDKGGVLINMKGDVEPCSFFKYIFINPTSYDYETYEQIIAHEKIHVKQGHTIDILLAELAAVVLWFNPFIWVLRKEVEKNIEYQTDDLMIKREEKAKENYQLNLVKLATNTQPLAITTNYNQSLIKQRILKMNAKKSNPYSYWKYTFIAPVLFGLLLFLNEPAKGSVQNTILLTTFETKADVGSEPNDSVATPMIDMPKAETISDQDSGANPMAATTPAIKTVEKASSGESTDAPASGCEKLSKAVQEQNITTIKALLKTVDPNCIEPNASAGFKRNYYRKVAHTPLSAAAKLGNLEIAGLLLDAGSNIDFHDVDLQSPLMAASNAGQLDFVKFLVKKGADINVISDSHGSALHCATKGDYLEIVTYLLEQGANINAYCHREGTPLNMAARNGHTEIMAFLLDKGALIDAENDTQTSALTRAATRGDQQTVAFLLSKGANMNPLGDQRPALHAAAQQGHTETVQLLLSKGADINLQSGEGTALIAAAWYGHAETVNLLLSKGANIGQQSNERGTALIAAAWNGHTETVDLLLSKGAKIDLQIDEQATVMNTPARPEFVTGVDMLFGANREMQSGKGLTALIAAARKGHTETVELLLSKGANIHLQNNEQGTVLIAAARNGRYGIVELLLSKGADINVQNDQLGSALTVAARNGQNKTVELLLSKGAGINAQNDRHGSALNAAARNGQLATVKLLVSKGADIDLHSKGEGTALVAAYRNAHHEVVAYLESKGAKYINED